MTFSKNQWTIFKRFYCHLIEGPFAFRERTRMISIQHCLVPRTIENRNVNCHISSPLQNSDKLKVIDFHNSTEPTDIRTLMKEYATCRNQNRWASRFHGFQELCGTCCNWSMNRYGFEPKPKKLKKKGRLRFGSVAWTHLYLS